MRARPAILWRSCSFVVLLHLAGCATAPAPQVILQPRPPLDQALAAPCTEPGEPDDWADYDATDDWIMHRVLPALEDCNRRHRAIVLEWER